MRHCSPLLIALPPLIFLVGYGCSSETAQSTQAVAPRLSTTAPAVDLSTYTVAVSHDGRLVEITVPLEPDYVIGPLQVLSAALKKYPKAVKFKVNWSMSVASAWGSNKVLYNRPAHILKYDDAGGQGTFKSESHALYTQVTDSVIHKAAKSKSLRHRSTKLFYLPHDAGFSGLTGFGCKLSVSNTKHS